MSNHQTISAFYLKISGFGTPNAELDERFSLVTKLTGVNPAEVACLHVVPQNFRTTIEPMAPTSSDVSATFDLLVTAANRDTIAPLIQARPVALRSTEDASIARLVRACQPSDLEIFLAPQMDGLFSADQEIWIGGECMRVESSELVDDYEPSTSQVLKVTVQRGVYATRARFHRIASDWEDWDPRNEFINDLVGPEVLTACSTWIGAEVQFGVVVDGEERPQWLGIIEGNPAIMGNPLQIRISCVSISAQLRRRKYDPPRAWYTPQARFTEYLVDFYGLPEYWQVPFADTAIGVGIPANYLGVCVDSTGDTEWEYARFVRDDEWVIIKLQTPTRTRIYRSGEPVPGRTDFAFFNIDWYKLPTYSEIEELGYETGIVAMGKGDQQYFVGNFVGLWFRGSHSGFAENIDLVQRVLSGAEYAEYAQPLTASTTIGAWIGSNLPWGCCLMLDSSYVSQTPALNDSTDEARFFFGSGDTAFFPLAYSGKKILEILSETYAPLCRGIATNIYGQIGIVSWGSADPALELFEDSESDSWELGDVPSISDRWIAPTVILNFKGLNRYDQTVINLASDTPTDRGFLAPIEIDVPGHIARTPNPWGRVVQLYSRGAFILRRKIISETRIDIGTAMSVNMSDIPGPALTFPGTLSGIVIGNTIGTLDRSQSLDVLVYNWQQSGDRTLKSWTMSGLVVSWDAVNDRLRIADNAFTSPSASGPRLDSDAWDVGEEVTVALIDSHGAILDTNKVTGVYGNSILQMSGPFGVTPTTDHAIVPVRMADQQPSYTDIVTSAAGYPPGHGANIGSGSMVDDDDNIVLAGVYG